MRPRSESAFELLRLGWLQAGLFGSAYRLAHLRAARSTVLGTLAVLFFLT